MRWLPVLMSVFLFASSASAAVQTERVEYRHGDVLLEGMLAYDDALPGKRPGILIAHEWTGVGEYVQRRARMLAELGFVVFALDMYGKGVYAKDHAEAAKLSGVFRQDRTFMRERAIEGLKVLAAQENADTSRLAAIGYCFGGSTVLELARSGAGLRGVVSFHGILKTPMPAEAGQVKAKIMVMHGDEDRSVTPEDIAAFRREMENAGADWQMVFFGGAVHRFTIKEAGSDKSTNAAYNEAADKRSWRMMLDFFEEIFNG